ncbi:hypothetical protein UA70_15085 [Raoultella planticola]|nr:hypothetical protein UA70_15085 [Raoultella planticola]
MKRSKRTRAREREQLAAWYQPIPEPASPVATRPVTPPPVSPVEAAAVTTLAAGVHQATSAGATAATVASTASSAAPLFSPASGGPRAQVKEGIGPKLPRPNHVRVPTRRELASYGIKLPSQRMAEERARKAELNQAYDDEPLTDEEADALEQDELARQFAATQQQRYGESTRRMKRMTPQLKLNWPVSCASQQQRYSSEQPQGATPFSPADYDFSPMKRWSMTVRANRCSHRCRRHRRRCSSTSSRHSSNRFNSINSRCRRRRYNNRISNLRSRLNLRRWRSSLSLPHRAISRSKPIRATCRSRQPRCRRRTSLIHPLLMRNGNSQPMQRPTTPLPSWIC